MRNSYYDVDPNVTYVIPSSNGGCDFEYTDQVYTFNWQERDTTIHVCDDDYVFTNLNGSRITIPFGADSVYSDTLKWNISKAVKTDTRASEAQMKEYSQLCDSVIMRWHIHFGSSTALTTEEKTEGCETAIYRRGKGSVTADMVAADTTLLASTDFNLVFVNRDGCDSVVHVSAFVPDKNALHETSYETYIDFYRYVDPVVKGRVEFIRKDTVIDVTTPVDVETKWGKTITCDSVFTRNITIMQPTWTSRTYNGCDSVLAISDEIDSIPLHADVNNLATKWYRLSELGSKEYDFDLPNADHTKEYLHVYIRLDSSVHHTHSMQGCDSVYFDVDKKWIKKDTVIVKKYTREGCDCDSTDTFKIDLNPVLRTDSVIESCGMVYFKNRGYDRKYFDTHSNIVYDTVRYTNGCGCDSVIKKVELVVHDPGEKTIDIDSCMYVTYNSMEMTGFDSWKGVEMSNPTGRDTIYQDPETFYVYGSSYGAPVDEHGCDSVFTVKLNVQKCYPSPVIINKYDWMLVLNKSMIDSFSIPKIDEEGQVVHGKDGNVVTVRFPIFATNNMRYRWYHVDIAGGDTIRELVSKNTDTLAYYAGSSRLEGCYQVATSADRFQDAEKTIWSGIYCISDKEDLKLVYNVYPDPVAIGESITLQCMFDATGAKLDVYNALGVNVLSRNVAATDVDRDGEETVTTLNINGQSVSGYYFIKLTMPDGRVLGEKFLVK